MLPKTTGLATSDRARTRPLALLRSCERRWRGVRGGTGWLCYYGMRGGLLGQFCLERKSTFLYLATAVFKQHGAAIRMEETHRMRQSEQIEVKTELMFFFLREIEKRRRSFWGWTTEEWIDTINARVKARQHAVAIAYPRLRPGTSPQALRIPPHGGHPALRSTTSGGFRSVLAVSSFRFRARLDLSITSAFSGQRGCEPRFLDMAPLI